MTLQQYAMNGSDGQAANTANTQAAQIVFDGGSVKFSAAKAFSGTTGLRLVSTTNNLCDVRFMAANSSMTMAATFGLTMPEADVPMWTSIASLRHAAGQACYFAYTPERRLAIQDRTRSAGATRYLVEGVAPGTKLRIALRAVVATATTGQYQINIYSGQSKTPLNTEPLVSTVFDFGTNPIVGGDFGILSVGVASAIAVGVDDVQFNDGSMSEIGPMGSDVSTVAVGSDLVWTGGEWR